jgi:hypothetical protein
LKTTLTVEMPVSGKHGKAMKPFPTLPTALGNSCGYFTHSHRLDDDGIYFCQVPPVKRYEAEIFEQGIRLADIMMPYFMKKTRELFLQKPGQLRGRLVHYTTAEAALKIIRTKRFWMRNTNCLSDFSEVQHGFDILQKFFAIKEKKESFTDALDDCIPGVASEAITAFNNSWKDIRFNSYIACLSEHQDSEDSNGRLSMWRAFGGTATRIGIVLNIPYTLSTLPLNIIFSSVAYFSESAAHEDMEEVIRNVRANREYLRLIGRDALVRLPFSYVFVSRGLSETRGLSRGEGVASNLCTDAWGLCTDAWAISTHGVIDRSRLRGAASRLQGSTRCVGFGPDRRLGFHADIRSPYHWTHTLSAAHLQRICGRIDEGWSRQFR